MPLVSVIIPNYNHAAFLKLRIDSVLNQTFQDFEVIILDDCSPDNSIELIETYKNHDKVSHIVYNDQNSGSPFKQWKKGIELAAGEFIWIAESDDYAVNGFLEKIFEVFVSNPNVKMVFSNSNEVDENNIFIRKASDWPQQLSANRWNESFVDAGNYEIENYLSVLNTIPNASAVVFKKELSHLIDKVMKYKISGDWLFWILALKNNDFGYVHETLNNFRSHSQTTRSKNLSTKTKARENYQIYNYASTLSKSKSIHHQIGLQHLFNYWTHNSLSVLRRNFTFEIFKLAYKADIRIANKIARLAKEDLIKYFK